CPSLRLRFKLADFDLLVHKLLVSFVTAGEFKRIRHFSFPLRHAGDHVRATKPMGLREVSRRPPGGMVRMRVIEADNVLSALTTFALDTHELARIDVIAVVRRIIASVAAARGGSHNTLLAVHSAKQNAAALVRISLFPVTAEGFVVGFINLKHSLD